MNGKRIKLKKKAENKVENGKMVMVETLEVITPDKIRTFKWLYDGEKVTCL